MAQSSKHICLESAKRDFSANFFQVLLALLESEEIFRLFFNVLQGLTVKTSLFLSCNLDVSSYTCDSFNADCLAGLAQNLPKNDF